MPEEFSLWTHLCVLLFKIKNANFIYSSSKEDIIDKSEKGSKVRFSYFFFFFFSFQSYIKDAVIFYLIVLACKAYNIYMIVSLFVQSQKKKMTPPHMYIIK